MSASWYSDYRKVITEEIRNREYKLLGEVEVSDEDYNKLLRYTYQVAKFSKDLKDASPDLLVALTLVQIAVRSYKEGTYWPCFNEEVGYELPTSRQSYLGRVFYKTIRLFGMFELQHEGDSSIQYVENIKAHAFVTNHYLDGFFDFTYAFYENNLFRQLPDTEIELYEDIEALSAFMKNSLHSNSNTLESEAGENRAAKSYRLLKSTRNVFAECTTKNINHLYYPVLKMLDQYYYDGNIDTIKSSRFKSAFLSWIERENESGASIHAASTDRKIRNRRPYIHVDLEREQVFLCIPAQKFRASDCEQGVDVSITVNGHTKDRKLELWNSFGIYISEPIEIAIPNLFDEIIVTFSTPDEKNYKINRKNYRFFNDHFDMVAKPTIGTNYVLFKKGEPIDCSDDRIIEYSKEYYNWEYLCVKMERDTIFSIGKQVLTIIGEYNTVPVFEEEISYYSVESLDGEKQLITYSHPYFSFDVEKKKLGGTFLNINGQNVPMKGLDAINIADSPLMQNSYAVNVDLSDLLGNVDGRYTVNLDIPGEPVKTICEYILLRDFRARRTKKYILFQNSFEVSVASSKHKLSIKDEWESMHYDEETGSIFYEIPCEEYKEFLAFDISLNGNETEKYILKLPVLMLAYGFSREKLTHKRERSIWYADIGPNLYVKFPETEKLWVYLDRDQSNLKEGIMIEPGLFQVDISEFQQSIAGNTDKRWRYLNIYFNVIGKHSTALPGILRKMSIDPYFTLLHNDEYGVHMNLTLMGKDEVLVSVKDHETEAVLIEEKHVNNGITQFPELNPGGIYDIQPIVRESDELGFFTTDYPKKPLIKVRCHEEGNIVNSSIKISKIYHKGHPLSFEGDFFLSITEAINDNQYIAEMHAEIFRRGSKLVTKKEKYGKLLLTIIDKGEYITATLLSYSNSEEGWMCPYYDKKKKDIIRYDDPVLLSMQHGAEERYIMLDDSETEVLIKEKNIRRL